jgi:hypothetical protein
MPWGPAGADATRAAVLAAALLVAQQVAAKATRDALFLSSFDVSRLPVMTSAAALLSLLAALGFARGIARLSPARLLPIALAANALLFALEWALALTAPRLAAVALYLHHGLAGTALLSSFFSLVNERFDPYSARRHMAAIGTGASLGGVAGGLLTWAASRVLSLPAMLLLLAGSSALAVSSVLRLGAATAASGRSARDAPSDGAITPSGLALIRRSPYLRALAVLVLLGAFLETLLDYLLNAAAAASFAKGAPLMGFFALFHTTCAFLILVVQATLVHPALARIGLAGTLAIQPGLAVLGCALALALPRLAGIVALRASQAVARSSFFRSSYELLYTPLPADQKRPTKVLVDVGCERLGTVVASGATGLVLLIAPSLQTGVLLWLSLLAAAATVVLARRFHGGYISALAANLRSGAVKLEAESVVDATTRLTLASIHQLPGSAASASGQAATSDARGSALLEKVADLTCGDPVRIRRVLEREELEPALVAHVIPLLARDDLFRPAVECLRAAARRSTGQLVDALLDRRQDVVVRRRIPRVLKSVPTQRSADGLLLGLSEERFDLRYRCAQALRRIRADGHDVELPRARIVEAVLRDADRVGTSSRHLEHVFTLLSLVLDQEPLDSALRALRSGDQALRGTALEYLDNVLPAAVREKLWPHVGGPQRPARSGRTADEIRDDLLRSATSLPRQESS